MENFILLVICFTLGILAQRWKRFPENSSQAFNAFVISVSLPALMLLKVPSIINNKTPVPHAWLPVAIMWSMFFFCWLIIHLLGQKLNWSKPKTGALILTTGLANTSFVGLPILKALIGDAAIPYAILADQPGEFLIVSTLGVLVASLYSGHQVTTTSILQRVLTFPPFITLIVCIPLSQSSIIENSLFQSTTQTLANTLVPLALFAVGHQCKIHWHIIQRRAQPLIIGLSLRLLIIPLILVFLFKLILPFDAPLPLAMEVSLLEAAMATQITSAVVANEFQLDGELANLMVAISIPISLVSVPLWQQILSRVF